MLPPSHLGDGAKQAAHQGALLRLEERDSRRGRQCWLHVDCTVSCFVLWRAVQAMPSGSPVAATREQWQQQNSAGSRACSVYVMAGNRKNIPEPIHCHRKAAGLPVW